MIIFSYYVFFFIHLFLFISFFLSLSFLYLYSSVFVCLFVFCIHMPEWFNTFDPECSWYKLTKIQQVFVFHQISIHTPIQNHHTESTLLNSSYTSINAFQHSLMMTQWTTLWKDSVLYTKFSFILPNYLKMKFDMHTWPGPLNAK